MENIKLERLDKILANAMVGSRKEVTKLIRFGEVFINEQKINDPSFKINPHTDKIVVNGENIFYKEHYHIMLNKPQNVVCATEDNFDKTVLDLISADYPKSKLFPAGRLDKDTEGFVFLTTDGKLGHRITGPKNHVNKVYFVTIDAPLEIEFVEKFKSGITLTDDYLCMPAQLEIIDDFNCYLTICEGKFHQVKRMFEALDRNVTYLKRVKIGGLMLDDSLKLGEYRELTSDELLALEKRD